MIGCLILVTVYHTGISGLAIAQVVKCASPGALYDSLCKDTPNLTLFTSVMNVMTDLCIFVLPIGPIMKLKIRKEKKYGILIIFLSGAV